MADVMRSTGPEEEPQDGNAEEQHASRSHGKGSKKKGSFWRELPILIVTALVLTILIQAFLARVYVIPSQSMEQTLHGCTGCTNDRILVDKVTFRFSEPQPGDVVVFRGPESWGQNEFDSPETENPVAGLFQAGASLIGFGAPNEQDFVKRVIATEGQTVSCCDAQNRVVVDGKPLAEPYIYWQPGRGEQQEDFAPVTVPRDKLWMMGDNRNDSSDSRFQSGGGPEAAVPVDNVIGKARVIVLPPTRWRAIADPNPQKAVALGAAPWQSGLPLGVGIAAAFPTVWIGRRLVGVTTNRGTRERRRS